MHLSQPSSASDCQIDDGPECAELKNDSEGLCRAMGVHDRELDDLCGMLDEFEKYLTPFLRQVDTAHGSHGHGVESRTSSPVVQFLQRSTGKVRYARWCLLKLQGLIDT